MAYGNVKITFSEDDVSTLYDLAGVLSGLYCWKSWKVSEDGAHIVFSAVDSADGIEKYGYIGTSGFAFKLEEDENKRFEEIEEWVEYDVNWDEDLDGSSNHVWGTDDDGKVVMVHD